LYGDTPISVVDDHSGQFGVGGQRFPAASYPVGRVDFPLKQDSVQQCPIADVESSPPRS